MAKESFCEFCGDPEETLYHVVFDCPVAKRFWSEVKKSLGDDNSTPPSEHLGDRCDVRQGMHACEGSYDRLWCLDFVDRSKRLAPWS